MKTADKKKWNKLKQEAIKLDRMTPNTPEQKAWLDNKRVLVIKRAARFACKHPNYFIKSAGETNA